MRLACFGVRSHSRETVHVPSAPNVLRTMELRPFSGIQLLCGSALGCCLVRFCSLRCVEAETLPALGFCVDVFGGPRFGASRIEF